MHGVCHCYRCTKARCEADPMVGEGRLAVFGDPRMMVMFLCVICGNKRCPRAADHDLKCSGSNEPGQPGSLYAISDGAGTASTTEQSKRSGTTKS